MCLPLNTSKGARRPMPMSSKSIKKKFQRRDLPMNYYPEKYLKKVTRRNKMTISLKEDK